MVSRQKSKGLDVYESGSHFKKFAGQFKIMFSTLIKIKQILFKNASEAQLTLHKGVCILLQCTPDFQLLKDLITS